MNSFKPKKTEKDVISIRIDTNLLNEIDSIATSNDISRNELIIQCLQYALDNMDKE